MFWAGGPFFQRGWASLRSRNLNMFTLVMIGTGVAWTYSAVATLAPELFPPAFHTMDGAVGVVCFEASAVITVLVLVGQVLELKARDGTSTAIRGLLDLAPGTARRLAADGTESDVPLDAVGVGDRPAGAGRARRCRSTARWRAARLSSTSRASRASRCPCRSAPATPSSPARSPAAGGLVIRADRVGRDTLLSRIVQLVAQAQRSRAPIQRTADRVSGWFVPAVLLCAAAAFAVWVTVGPEPRFASRGDRRRVGADHRLPLRARPRHAHVDHGRGRPGRRGRCAHPRRRGAGTFREGRHGGARQDRDADERQARRRGGRRRRGFRGGRGADAGRRGSSAPASTRWRGAIVEGATARKLDLAAAEGFDAPAGRGVSARVGGRAVLVGSRRFLGERGVETGALRAEADAVRAKGATAVLVAVDGRLAGVVGVADAVRPEAATVVEALKAAGLRVVMLTGDNSATARAIAGPLGIDEVEADMLPDAKAAAVERLKREGRVVAVAGDGVNDAPALALADVGIAMGTGTDIAMQSAGVTLLGGDLAGLLRARNLSKATMGNIRQNLAFAFLYNGIGVPVAAGVLYPVFGLLLSPMLAAAAMALSSVSVIGNALRLRSADLG